MNSKILKNNRGYTLVEMLFYIVLFSMLSILVINSIIVMMQSFKEIRIQSEISEGSNIMERISREIKQAYQINNLDNPNDLRLDIKFDEDTTKIVEFYFTDSDVELKEDGTYIGDLNSPDIKIIDLTFTQISTSKGKAIKVFLTIMSNNDTKEREYYFYNTLVLRGNY